MAFFISTILVLFILSGCSSQEVTPAKKQEATKHITSASDDLKVFHEQEAHRKENVPAMILPPVYEDISVFDNQEITFAAENADLHTILYSISKIAGLNLIIDKEVNHTPITLSVEDASLADTLDIIMDISGAYYVVQGNILHVKEFMRKKFNVPYVHSSTSFNTDLGGDTLGSATAGGSSSGGGGSSSKDGISGNFQLQFKSPKGSNNFYNQLEKNIKALLSKEKKENEQVVQNMQKIKSESNDRGLTSQKNVLPKDNSSKTNQNYETRSYHVKSPGGQYTLNRFTGVLSVYDKKKNVMAIENFIKSVKEQSSKSILIEAKLLEVTLNNGHQLGVDWSAVANDIAKTGNKLVLAQTLSLTGAVAGTATYTSKNLNAVVNALDSSGDVETLSNPRIKVLSGQSAIISSGKLVPFWEKEVQTDQGTGGSASNTQVTYNRRDVLDGITMGVTPTIMENGHIMLNVIPIASHIVKVIEHFDEKGASVASAPILNIKEAGTIIEAKDNDMVLIGGLISSDKKTDEEKIPFLSSIPYIGKFFTKTNNTLEKKELVILIRLRVIK